MKRISFLILICLSSLVSTAQLSISGKKPIIINRNSVKVILFDSITSNTEISYSGTNVRFYKYVDAQSNTNPIYPTLNPEDATGYIVKVDDVAKDTIWVIDYCKHKPILKSVEPDTQSPSPCTELNLRIESAVPLLTYQTPNSTTYSLTRKFKITYKTKEWNGNAWSPSKTLTDSIILTNNSPTNKLITTVPLCDTQFTILGDQYAELLGVTIPPAVSQLYTAQAVECHFTAVVTERNEHNEAEAPKKVNGNTTVSFSAPIDVQFLSNANDAAKFFKWSIYKDGQLILTRNDSEHRYTFTDYGTYKIVILASNATCSYTDSITINAYEAAIQVPNVFTPNGDGNNDEFRVAYKSLLGFECWVYNRWGRQVFFWNDPQKGWNGKINGVDAVEGPYFYVIKATGYGLDPKTKHDPKVKSTIILKGDINLLRGSKK
jgi:gliding motility-associated-like protein